MWWSYLSLGVGLIWAFIEKWNLFKKPRTPKKIGIASLIIIGAIASVGKQCSENKPISSKETFMKQTRVPGVFIPPQFTYG